MTLADFLATNQQQVVDRWREHARKCVRADVDELQLINEIPWLINRLVESLRNSAGEHIRQPAEHHGLQRLEIGADIAGLTEEVALLEETMVELACEAGFPVCGSDIQRLIRIMSRTTALAVQAYADMRDRQLADEAARHFSFVAHEIRNPLNSARLVAEVMTVAPEEQRPGHLNRLQRALLRLSTRVDNALAEARLYGETRLDIQHVPVANLLEGVWDDVSSQAEDYGVAVKPRFERFEFDGDPKLITSALINLVSSAIQFSSPGGRVDMAARTLGDRVLLEVIDESGQLPENIRRSLEQPSPPPEPETDMDLGLVIARQVADAHGGSLGLSESAGEGFGFVLELPRYQTKKDEAKD